MKAKDFLLENPYPSGVDWEAYTKWCQSFIESVELNVDSLTAILEKAYGEGYRDGEVSGANKEWERQG